MMDFTLAKEETKNEFAPVKGANGVVLHKEIRPKVNF
jgi:hypothetical protein